MPFLLGSPARSPGANGAAAHHLPPGAARSVQARSVPAALTAPCLLAGVLLRALPVVGLRVVHRRAGDNPRSGEAVLVAILRTEVIPGRPVLQALLGQDDRRRIRDGAGKEGPVADVDLDHLPDQLG